jgi:hypothetical protein
MQKVVGSNPISRSERLPLLSGGSNEKDRTEAAQLVAH